MEDGLSAREGGDAVKARSLEHLEGFRDAPAHVLGAVGVGPYGDELAAALLEPVQEGGPAVQIPAPAPTGR